MNGKFSQMDIVRYFGTQQVPIGMPGRTDRRAGGRAHGRAGVRTDLDTSFINTAIELHLLTLKYNYCTQSQPKLKASQT